MKKIIFALLLLVFSSISAHASAYGKVNAGNRLYQKGQYEKAMEKYRDAQIAAPNNEKIIFNMGNALHKAEKYEEADTEYKKTLSSKDSIVKSRAYYNLGNNCVMQNKNDEAIEYYKKALDINPNDINAKYNIEFLKLLKTNPKACKNPCEDGKDKQKQDKEKGPSDEERKDKQDKQEKGAKGKEDKNKMSNEDAKRILQYFNDAEKQAAEKRKMKIPQLPKIEEDW